MSEPTPQTSPSPSSGDSDLAPGQRVGEYVVDDKLGEGAFGTVFRATHPLIGKVVAIKVLARKFSVDPEMVSRFVAEAKAVNQIRHRHIIDIFSFSQLADGRHYYVMEYLDGETLDARIERDGKLSLADALPILRGIGRALDAAHAKGIAHRDLKAENVFLAADSGGVFPKLLDFGIAKLLSPEDTALEQGVKHKTRTGTPVGTPYYMSPEQCRGRDVDHRTDLYAFGVLAYLLLTGKYPHDADDYMSILMRQLTMEPDPPSSVNPSLPTGVDDAIGWLIAKDPADRPPNLRAAVAALETVAVEAGMSIATDGWDASPASSETRPVNTSSARSSGMPRAATPWPSQKSNPGATAEPVVLAQTRRNRGIVIVGFAVLVVAVMLIVFRPWEHPSPPASEPAREPAREPVIVDSPKPAPKQVPEAQNVIIDVSGVPDGTEVLVGGMTVGAAPGPVQLPKDPGPLVMVFKADGYRVESRTITPDRDQMLDVPLKKKAAAVKRPTKDDIIDNPFKKTP
ncbi:MAG: serine/threonine protein kinase [Deltaproteobacteria bacterium]|nr:serine/threonine protein kinase [Deltaproteobacteria bacterium]